MMDEDKPPSVNFVPCMKWIRRGVARQHSIKVELTKNELKELFDAEKAKYKKPRETGGGGGECSNRGQTETSPYDEYNFENYDDDDEEAPFSIADIAVFENEDEDDGNMEEEGGEDDEEDSDAEDDVIKPEDNLLLVGHVEGFSSSLEVFVHNSFEDSLYVHHDIWLPSIPLSLEWLNYDPGNVDRAANLCAVGSMSPVIDVWDVDVVNAIEPLYKLGKKGSKKKGTPQVGHKDAVLDLSWNTNLTHILASGSADKTVLLWDLEQKSPHTTLTAFEERIQCLQWHPVEVHALLTGSCDRTCKIFDCRTADSFKSWSLDGELERVTWNHYTPYQFLCSDGNGVVCGLDARQEGGTLWKIAAHSKEVTGLVLSPLCPGFLGTASQDGTCKVWDFHGGQPELVHERNGKVGEIQCMEMAPDDPFLVALGGDKKQMNMVVFSAKEISAVNARFGSRELTEERAVDGVNPSTSVPYTVHPVVKGERRSKPNLKAKMTKTRRAIKKFK